MSSFQRRLTLLTDNLQLLNEEYEGEKQHRVAPFQQRQSELERELEDVKRRRRAASEEVEQEYKARFDECTRSFSCFSPTQATEFPASTNFGRGVRKGQNINNRVPGVDRPDNDDGSAYNDDGLGHDNGSEDDGPNHVNESPDKGNESPDNDNELADNNGPAHNHDEPTSSALVSPRTSRKRKPTTKAQSNLEGPKKMPRRGGKIASSGTGVDRVRVVASYGDRMVSFRDVNGKHRIVKWPTDSDKFYILRCDEHKLFFNSPNPIQGAGKHLRSAGHSNGSGAHEDAINELGFLVQDCTQEQADKNNHAIDQLFQRPQSTAAGRAGRGFKSSSDPKARFQPISGEFYQACWHVGGRSRLNATYVALCLPTDSFDTVGISGSIYDTGLVHPIPKCYRTHTRTNQILGWSEGYQYGGAKSSQRKFPFLFFTDDVQVPSEGVFSIPKNKNLLSWVPAKDIEPFDFNDSTTSHLLGHATAFAFASRLLHQHKSAITIDNRSFARTDSGPLSDAQDDNGFGGQSQADSLQKAPTLVASASPLASNSKTRRHSTHAEHLAVDTLRSEPEQPVLPDKADNSASSAPTAMAPTSLLSSSEINREHIHAEQAVADASHSKQQPVPDMRGHEPQVGGIKGCLQYILGE
ncbi:hypothetical protein RB596_000183 [Gaeumannomyces avenae]